MDGWQSALMHDCPAVIATGWAALVPPSWMHRRFFLGTGLQRKERAARKSADIPSSMLTSGASFLFGSFMHLLSSCCVFKLSAPVRIVGSFTYH